MAKVPLGKPVIDPPANTQVWRAFFEDIAKAVSALTNPPSYTVAALPSAAVAGRTIFVSDEVGGAVLAFSDGTNWRRVTDRTIVS